MARPARASTPVLKGRPGGRQRPPAPIDCESDSALAAGSLQHNIFYAKRTDALLKLNAGRPGISPCELVALAGRLGTGVFRSLRRDESDGAIIRKVLMQRRVCNMARFLGSQLTRLGLAARQRGAKNRWSARPAVEALENRTLPSVSLDASGLASVIGTPQHDNFVIPV